MALFICSCTIRFSNTTSWSQLAYLKAGEAAASDYFGSSVGIDNDTLVTGARNKTVTNTQWSFHWRW
ncbi:MAG: FG-GAP repeat protein [Gammaproteobacteria bacterium]